MVSVHVLLTDTVKMFKSAYINPVMHKMPG